MESGIETDSDSETSNGNFTDKFRISQVHREEPEFAPGGVGTDSFLHNLSDLSLSEFLASVRVPSPPPLSTVTWCGNAEPETSSNFVKAKPEAKPVVKPEVKLEVKLEVKPEAKPEVKPEVKPEAKPTIEHIRYTSTVPKKLGGSSPDGNTLVCDSFEDDLAKLVLPPPPTLVRPESPDVDALLDTITSNSSYINELKVETDFSTEIGRHSSPEQQVVSSVSPPPAGNLSPIPPTSPEFSLKLATNDIVVLKPPTGPHISPNNSHATTLADVEGANSRTFTASRTKPPKTGLKPTARPVETGLKFTGKPPEPGSESAALASAANSAESPDSPKDIRIESEIFAPPTSTSNISSFDEESKHRHPGAPSSSMKQSASRVSISSMIRRTPPPPPPRTSSSVQNSPVVGRPNRRISLDQHRTNPASLPHLPQSSSLSKLVNVAMSRQDSQSDAESISLPTSAVAHIRPCAIRSCASFAVENIDAGTSDMEVEFKIPEMRNHVRANSLNEKSPTTVANHSSILSNLKSKLRSYWSPSLPKKKMTTYETARSSQASVPNGLPVLSLPEGHPALAASYASEFGNVRHGSTMSFRTADEFQADGEDSPYFDRRRTTIGPSNTFNTYDGYS